MATTSHACADATREAMRILARRRPTPRPSDVRSSHLPTPHGERVEPRPRWTARQNSARYGNRGFLQWSQHRLE